MLLVPLVPLLTSLQLLLSFMSVNLKRTQGGASIVGSLPSAQAIV